MRVIQRTAGGQNSDDIEIRESDDQREQRRDSDDVAHHRQRHVPDALPPIGAVDCRCLISCSGTDFSAAKYMIMKNGAPYQTLTKMTEKRAQAASPVQGIGPMPKNESI